MNRASPTARAARVAAVALVGASLAFGALAVKADSAGGPTVMIQDFQFEPAEITVKKGATVRWVNAEKRQYHSVWFEESGDPEPDYFFPEEFYERTFEVPGSFPYRCGPHPRMQGVVRVVE